MTDLTRKTARELTIEEIESGINKTLVQTLNIPDQSTTTNTTINQILTGLEDGKIYKITTTYEVARRGSDGGRAVMQLRIDSAVKTSAGIGESSGITEVPDASAGGSSVYVGAYTSGEVWDISVNTFSTATASVIQRMKVIIEENPYYETTTKFGIA